MPTRWIDVLHALRAPFVAVFPTIATLVSHLQRKRVAASPEAPSAPVATSSSGSAIRLAYSSWIEDGRRLRALRRANSLASSIAPSAQTAAPPTLRVSQQQVYRIGAPASTTLPLPAPAPATTPAPVSLPLSAENATPFAAPAALAADQAPGDTSWVDDLSNLPTSLDDVDKLTEAQRRLVFLRYMVRQRIYNEGFTPQQTPEQYRPRERQPDDHGDQHADRSERHPQSDWN